MSPFIQVRGQLQYVFISLLLAGFAIPAMGERDKTPNRKEIILNSIQQVACAGEKVDLRGELHIRFGIREFFGVRSLRPVEIKLEKGFSGNCPGNGDCLVGIGKTTQRRFVASKRIEIPGGIETEEVNGLGVGKFKIRLTVTGNPNPPPQGDPCPRCTNRFGLLYTVTYKFNKNDKVTFFKATPDIRCN